ncbi:MAG TPA: FixH family protein [Steroidobacteraceae bacterium]|nr:FixH family protein [Steroidobacteraceae bacterium]
MIGKSANSTVIVMLSILGVAVVASVAAGTYAALTADPELPAQYHWEGAQYDQDVARAEHAAALGVQAVLMQAGPQSCRLRLELRGAAPQELHLLLVHATNPALDRRLVLRRHDGTYDGACAGLTSEHYHVELTDAADTWSVRRELTGAVNGLRLIAQGSTQ